MRKKLKRFKVLYMGGNLLGCMCLKELLRWRRIEIISVIGRYCDNGCILDPKAWNASLLRVATQKDLPFLQPKLAKSKKFIETLEELERPDFIISVQYDKILGTELLNYPKLGCVNIHYAMLPYNRGCLPIPWALIDKQPVGVTIHWMDENIDTGDIIASREVDISADDTAYSVYLNVTKCAYKLFKEVFPLVLESQAPRKRQPKNGVAYRTPGYPYDRNIDWSWDADKIDRMIRALTFPQFPGARTYYGDIEIEVLNPVKIVTHEKNGHKPGQIIDISTDGILVQSNEDCLLIPRVKINESIMMDAYKFSSKFDVSVGDLLGIEN